MVIATERAKRPDSFRQKEKDELKSDSICPFCEGNEKMTPPEIYSIRKNGGEPDSPGWLIRVVPNLYKAFEECADDPEPVFSSNLTESFPALGTHEVLIAGPEHEDNIANVSGRLFLLLFEVFKERYRELALKNDVKYVQFIINHGKKAGASLEHAHGQLFAIPIVPEELDRELINSSRYYSENGKCIFCEIIAEEMAMGERVVEEAKGFINLCPFASFSPFEMNIMPIEHSGNFESMSDEELRRFTDFLHHSLKLLDAALKNPPYNLYLHTSPCRESIDHYHWHVEVVPKLSIAAGFEMGTGIYINVVNPEEAANYLRSYRSQ